MFDAIIIFKDNTEMIIQNVIKYTWGEVPGVVTVEKNDFRQFYNADEVKCIFPDE